MVTTRRTRVARGASYHAVSPRVTKCPSVEEQPRTPRVARSKSTIHVASVRTKKTTAKQQSSIEQIPESALSELQNLEFKAAIKSSKSKKSTVVKREPTATIEQIGDTVMSQLIDLKWNVPTFTKHLESHRQNVANLITRCVELKESNSILLEGPPGSGKRGLVRNAIRSYEQSRKTNNSKGQLKFVQLDGDVLPDVKSCLREISRQLLVNNRKHEQLMINIADINENEEIDDDKMEVDGSTDMSGVSMTVGKSLSFVLNALQDSRDSDGIVFVLQSFENFVQSKNQMLLYNLFDTCQSFKTPLLVIALSARLDSTELLEKRVKSRFSHRSIALSQDMAFDQWTACAKELLTVSPLSKSDSVSRSWNKAVDTFINSDSVLVTLECLFHSFPTINFLKSLFQQLIFSCDFDKHFDLTKCDHLLVSTLAKMNRGVHSNIHKNISVSELIMLAAMCKIVKRSENNCEDVTFAAVYQEYTTFERRNQTHRKIDKSLAMNCFDSLIMLRVVTRSDSIWRFGGNKAALKVFRKFRLTLDVTKVEDIIRRHPACPSNIKIWALGIGDV